MKPCLKRQHEVYKGTERHRCLEPTAEHHRQFVTAAECSDCPVRKFRPGRDTSNDLPIIDRYPECPFRYQSVKGQTCAITKHSVTPEVCNRCDTETREHEAEGFDKVKHFFGAVRRWVAHGRPTRTDEEVLAIFDDWCSTCDRYDPDTHSCKNCGCSVNTDSSPLSNKLKMKTEVCPLGLWE